MKKLHRSILNSYIGMGLIVVCFVGGLGLHAHVIAQTATESSISDTSIRSLIATGALEQAEDHILVRHAALQAELALARSKLTGDRRHCLASERLINNALEVNRTDPHLLSIAGQLFMNIDKNGKAVRLLEGIDAEQATYSESQALIAMAYGRMVTMQLQLYEDGEKTRQWDNEFFVSVTDDKRVTDEPRSSGPTDLERMRWLERAREALDKARKSTTPSPAIHYADAFLIKVEGEFRKTKPSETQPAMLRAYAKYIESVEPSVMNYRAVALAASRLKAAGRPVPEDITTKLDRLSMLTMLVLQRQRLEKPTHSDVAFQAVSAIFVSDEKLGVVTSMDYTPDQGLSVKTSSDIPQPDIKAFVSSADFRLDFTDVSILPGEQGQAELIIQLKRPRTEYKRLPEYSDEQLERLREQSDAYWRKYKTSPPRRFEEIAPWMADHVVILHEVSFSEVEDKAIPALMSLIKRSLGDVPSAPASISVGSRGGGVYDLTYSLHIFFDRPESVAPVE